MTPREALNRIAIMAATTGTPEGDKALLLRITAISSLAARAIETARCASCQDRPGFDGLGRRCKACAGTGWKGGA